MLLKLTESCSMGCIHCMSSCVPDETTHMTDETFEQVIKFIKNHYFGVIVVSGGEPTEHPKFCEYIKRLTSEISELNKLCAPQIAICTNGVWIDNNFNEFKELYNELKSFNVNVLWQITNVPGLYPKQLSEYTIKRLNKMKNVTVDSTTSNSILYPQGRTLDNNLEWKAKGPKCFNIRSISKNATTLDQALVLLASYGKFCTPAIEYDGSFKLGESYLCPKCCTIWDDKHDIIKSMKEFKCTKCKETISCLPEEAKSIIM